MAMFEKAVKSQGKLRCAIFGTSGSGKTFSALRIANGIGGKVAVIDTEHYSSSKYADRFDFDVCNLESKNIDSYIDTINHAAKLNYDVLIIDSLSHAWGELLKEVEQIARAKFRGNTWSAWSEGTPKQKKLIESLITFPGHVIGTMRCKTEWTMETTSKGTSRPVRVAMAPEQGKGIEYEFDLLMEMSPDHIARVTKDRTGKYQDKIIECPGEDFGKELSDWLSDGKPPKLISETQLANIKESLNKHDVDTDALMNFYNITKLKELPEQKYDQLIQIVSKKPLKKESNND